MNRTGTANSQAHHGGKIQSPIIYDIRSQVHLRGNTIYDDTYVRELFDQMSCSYGMSRFLSFGVLSFLRSKAVALLNLQQGMTVYDFMAGRGECWRNILRSIGPYGNLIGIDFSSQMLQIAEEKVSKYPRYQITLICDDLLQCTQLCQADAVVCAFGLKTLGEQGITRFAEQLVRALKPRGKFALVELRIPRFGIVGRFSSHYACHIVPRLLTWLGYRAEPYRHLQTYLARQDEWLIVESLRKRGLTVECRYILFGLGIIYWGEK